MWRHVVLSPSISDLVTATERVLCRSCPTSVSFVKIDLLTVNGLLKGINDYLSLLSTFVVRFGWNSVYEICTLCSAREFRECKRSGGRLFDMGLNERTCRSMP